MLDLLPYGHDTVLEASRVSEEQMDDYFTHSDTGERPPLALAS